MRVMTITEARQEFIAALNAYEVIDQRLKSLRENNGREDDIEMALEALENEHTDVVITENEYYRAMLRDGESHNEAVRQIQRIQMQTIGRFM